MPIDPLNLAALEKLHALSKPRAIERAPSCLTAPFDNEEPSLPPVLKRTVVAATCLTGLFFAWASLTTIDETIIATGQVTPRGHLQAVQHLEGGIIHDISVDDGQLVEQGQTLMRFDATAATADLGQVEARREALNVEAARLRRFASLAASAPLADMTGDDRAILDSMEEARASQRRVVSDQIAQKEKELASVVATRATLHKNIALLAQENEIRQNLAKKGYGSKLMAIASQREFNEAQGRFSDAALLETRARDALSEARGKLEALDADLHQQAMKKLGEVEAQIAEISSSLAKYKSAAERTLVTSPVRGYVKGMSIHTLGAVVEPGKLLLEIVPVDSPLIVEAVIAPQDVGRLSDGAKAKIKVSAFDYARYGYATGVLQNVSASTFQTQDGKSYYKARILLDSPSVGADGKSNMLVPGMTVEASLLTGEKTILQYLLKPVYAVTQSALHEH